MKMKSKYIKIIHENMPDGVSFHFGDNTDLEEGEFFAILALVRAYKNFVLKYGPTKRFIIHCPTISKRYFIDFGLSHIENKGGALITGPLGHVVYLNSFKQKTTFANLMKYT